MTTTAMNLNEMKLMFDTKSMSESDIQKVQEFEKTICADKDFLAAEDVRSACQTILKYVDQTQEEILAKYEDLKESLAKQFQSLMGERELTDKELDAVDGGGFFDWIGRNWKGMLIGAAVGVVVMLGVAATCGTVTLALGAAAGTMGAGVGGWSGGELQEEWRKG